MKHFLAIFFLCCTIICYSQGSVSPERIHDKPTMFDNTAFMICDKSDTSLYDYLLDSVLDNRYHVMNNSDKYNYYYLDGNRLEERPFSDRQEFEETREKGEYINSTEWAKGGEMLFSHDPPTFGEHRRIILDVDRIFDTAMHFCNDGADTQYVHLRFWIHQDSLWMVGRTICHQFVSTDCPHCPVYTTLLYPYGWAPQMEIIGRMRRKLTRFYENWRGWSPYDTIE